MEEPIRDPFRRSVSEASKDQKNTADLVRQGVEKTDANHFEIKPKIAEKFGRHGDTREKPDDSRKFPKGIVWGVVALILAFMVPFGYFIYATARDRVTQSVADNVSQLQAGMRDLRNLNTQSAEKNFLTTRDDTGLDFGGKVEQFKSLFGGAGELVGGFRNISSLGVELTKEIAYFEDNLLDLFFKKKGSEFVVHLESVKRIVDDIQKEANRISSNTSLLDRFSPNISTDLFPLKLDIARLQNFLGAFIAWLKSDSPRHIIVLLQNPAEIRPAGGFLGSYAHITLQNGSVESVDVRDINDADRLFPLKIIPPLPLQAAVTRLRAADANWFFDFKESAKLVLKLVESSTLYVNQGIAFDGAIAISPKILEDILHITGPIKIEKEKLTLDEKNFLQEIQKKVQAGQATRATYPKSILKSLYEELAAKVTTLDEQKKKDFFRAALGWTDAKDLMFYFSAEGGSASGGKDSDLQNFFEGFGAAGTVYAPASNFEGDYLAVVDANIGGGKSDIFIKQDITLQSQINADGTVANHLVIKREHKGGTSPYWWHKTPNEDYLQVFVPPGSRLVNFKGGTEKKIIPAVNYAKNNYIDDPSVVAVNSSTQKVFNYPAVLRHEEAGKDVFSTWVKIKPGEKTETVFDYSHRLFLAPADGTTYQFVFEKQAGTSRHYKFEISAPVGFRFREDQLPVYEYETDDPPGRLILDLTLEKI